MKYHIGELSCLSICHQIKVPITLSFGFGICMCVSACVCVCFVSQRAMPNINCLLFIQFIMTAVFLRSVAHSLFSLNWIWTLATANSFFSLFSFVAINLFRQFDSKFARTLVHSCTPLYILLEQQKGFPNIFLKTWNKLEWVGKNGKINQKIVWNNFTAVNYEKLSHRIHNRCKFTW